MRIVIWKVCILFFCKLQFSLVMSGMKREIKCFILLSVQASKKAGICNGYPSPIIRCRLEYLCKYGECLSLKEMKIYEVLFDYIVAFDKNSAVLGSELYSGFQKANDIVRCK